MQLYPIRSHLGYLQERTWEQRPGSFPGLCCQVLSRGYRSPDWGGTPVLRGYLSPVYGGYPSPGQGSTQSKLGVPCYRGTPQPGLGYPLTDTGLTSPCDRTERVVLATQRAAAVCLLRSSMRTFFYFYKIGEKRDAFHPSYKLLGNAVFVQENDKIKQKGKKISPAAAQDLQPMNETTIKIQAINISPNL